MTLSRSGQHPGALLRWMYRGGHPNRLASMMNRGTALVATAGFGPARMVTLEVRGRRSGRLVSFPVVVAEHQGERYLVSMLGNDAQWVSNVRAAGGQVALRHGRSETVHLEEIDTSLRAPILQRYLELAPGARPHIPVDPRAPLEDFERIAGAFPVFLIHADAPLPDGGVALKSEARAADPAPIG